MKTKTKPLQASAQAKSLKGLSDDTMMLSDLQSSPGPCTPAVPPLEEHTPLTGYCCQPGDLSGDKSAKPLTDLTRVDACYTEQSQEKQTDTGATHYQAHRSIH